MRLFDVATRLALLALLHHANANPLVKQSRLTLQCAPGTFSNVVTTTGVSITVEKAVPVAENGSSGEGSVSHPFQFPTRSRLSFPQINVLLISSSPIKDFQTYQQASLNFVRSLLV